MKGEFYLSPKKNKRGEIINKTLDRKNLKDIRKRTKDKIEYEKCKKWYREHGFVHVHENGLFIEEINLMICGRYVHIDDEKCLRCGKCCKLVDDNNNITDVDCGLLQKDETGQLYCVAYDMKERIGMKIDKDGAIPEGDPNIDSNVICIPRVWQSNKIDGCPYNDELRGWF